MTRISQSTIERIQDVDLVTVVREYVPDLKKAGASYKGKSPWTDEKTPSFTVTPARNMFKCFSSGNGGIGPITFVMRKEKCDYIEAVKIVASIANERIEYDEENETPELAKQREGKTNHIETLYKICEASAIKFHEQLAIVETQNFASLAIAEITKRKFTPDTLTQFQIGYAPGDSNAFAPNDWKFITNLCGDKSYAGAVELGLIKTKNGHTYDTFRHRLIYPIHNHLGRVVAFGGRALPTQCVGGGVETQNLASLPYTPAKYINSSDSPIYHKEAVLYGLHQAGKAIRACGYAYLMEGYSDVVSMHQAGYTCSVGTCGTALTEKQCQLLKKFCSKVVLFFDGDEAGQKATARAIDMLVPYGFEVTVVPMPAGTKDPDELVRMFEVETQRKAQDEAAHNAAKPLPATLHEYILFNETPGILWKAAQLLGPGQSDGVETQNIASLSPMERNNRVADICRTIALMPQAHQVAKDDYIATLAKEYRLNRKTLEKLVADATATNSPLLRRGAVRKNQVATLTTKAETFPFFQELIVETKNGKTFKGVDINILKFVQLLASFGFSRYSNNEIEKDEKNFTFVRIQDNVICEVSKQEIIDHIEHFIQKDYDFDKAGCVYVDAEYLLNEFYKNISKYFSKDIFFRVRSAAPIIISKDTATECYLYFKNGFVRITKEGYDLIKYDKMDGSVWDKQIRPRNFEKKELPLVAMADDDDNNVQTQNFASLPNGEPEPKIDWENSFSPERPLGDYADFIWRISGQKQQRFISLCTILGYLSHDYYDYVLKAIFLTDSVVSEHSNGRTGKSLSMQMLGESRSYCEINGKQFDQGSEQKYSLADSTTQIVCINDLTHRGKNKFSMDAMFNDITDGYMIRHLFKGIFRHYSKFVLTSNKIPLLEGDSMQDRVLEFEVSSFFSPKRRPKDYYGKWFGTEWTETDYSQFDNFICFCVQAFLTHGLVPPDTINMEARKLLDSTSREFLEFMADITESIKAVGLPWKEYGEIGDQLPQEKREEGMSEFRFDKNQLFNRFIQQYPDYKAWHISQNKFTRWLCLYSHLKLGVKDPQQPRSSGTHYIIFKSEKP